MTQPDPEHPLSGEDAAVADRVAHRIHDEVRGLLSRLPDRVRGGSALSRHLDLNRATCQRIMSVLAARPDRYLLTRVPGVQGLRQFLDALRRSGLEEEALASADAAVDQYEEFLDRVGGSQSRLASRLELAAAGGEGTAGPGADLALARHRATLFESAAGLCGRSSDVCVTLYAYRPDPRDRGRIESLTVSGHIGHRAGADAVPLVVVAGSHPISSDPDTRARAFDSLDRTPARGRTPGAVLQEFSTDPLPMVTSQGPGGMLLQTVDPQAYRPGTSLDIVFGHRPSASSPHPVTEDPPVQESWSLQHYPARHLIFDLWLHRDLARSCIPSVDLHLYATNFPAFVGHRWISRFPHGPRLELLGAGLRRSGASRYSRMPELLGHVFQLVDWPAPAFVGHRCEVEHPVWRGGYCITCDFSRGDEDELLACD